MQGLDSIKRQIARLKGYYIFFTEKEIKYLPQVMADDERIIGLTSGYVAGDTWLAVCTNRQVIFANRGMIYGIEQYQMPLSRIQSIDFKTGVLFGSVRIWDGAKSIHIDWIWKSSIAPFVRAVQNAMQAEAMGRPLPGLNAGNENIASQLEKLAKLKASGMLTHEEFEEQKKKLLG